MKPDFSFEKIAFLRDFHFFGNACCFRGIRVCIKFKSNSIVKIERGQLGRIWDMIY